MCIWTSRRTTSQEYTAPVGLEYTGTHHMPLMAGSAATSSSIEIDVGSVVVHRHGNHLDAEGLGDREVPVVARRGAQELDRRLRSIQGRGDRRRRAASRRPRRRASVPGWRCCRRSGWAPGYRAARRRSPAARAGRAGRRSCGCRCPRRRGSCPHRAGSAGHWTGPVAALEGLPRVRSRASFLACSSA